MAVLMQFSVLAIILGAVAAASTNELQIQTTRGWVEGGYTNTRGGRRVMQFLGIPYAKAPVKELSFKDPVEPDLWDGMRNATVECGMCMQQFIILDAVWDKVLGVDDCLCVNVYTPNTSTSTKLPVIFFIHGGAYSGLSMAKSFYGPEMLLDKDVVLVTASFRLGVLGFMTTGDSVIPGNWALKDQAAALRWVKANVHKFGGDPDSITLMGQGTGAGSVHLHMLSPLTKDLFHRGMIHSGSGLCLWGFSERAILKKASSTVAVAIGCPSQPSEKFLECLQKTDSKTIVDTTWRFRFFDQDPFAFWRPVVERADVKGAFMVQNPFALTSTKPLLAGYNNAEGMIKILSLIAGDAKKIDAKFYQWNKEFYRTTPVSLLYGPTASDPAEITKRVWDFYIDSNRNAWSDKFFKGAVWPDVKTLYLPQLNRMFGDFWFTNGVLDAVEKHSGPKYLYHFNYNTTVSVCSNLFNNTEFYGGACHFDELMYLFPMEIKTNNFFDPESPDYKLSLKMVELWTNFAKNSVPTANGVTWSPVRTRYMEHVEITKSGFRMTSNPITNRRSFWKSLKL